MNFFRQNFSQTCVWGIVLLCICGVRPAAAEDVYELKLEFFSSDAATGTPLPGKTLAALSEGDGGVFKLGTGKVTLNGSLASVTGRVDVLGGTFAGTTGGWRATRPSH